LDKKPKAKSKGLIICVKQDKYGAFNTVAAFMFILLTFLQVNQIIYTDKSKYCIKQVDNEGTNALYKSCLCVFNVD